MNKWTKRIPKKNGYYWFWTSKLFGIPTIILVENGGMAPLVNLDMKPISHVIQHCPDYKFGPRIEEPSVRDLNKKMVLKSS